MGSFNAAASRFSFKGGARTAMSKPVSEKDRRKHLGRAGVVDEQGAGDAMVAASGRGRGSSRARRPLRSGPSAIAVAGAGKLRGEAAGAPHAGDEPQLGCAVCERGAWRRLADSGGTLGVMHVGLGQTGTRKPIVPVFS